MILLPTKPPTRDESIPMASAQEIAADVATIRAACPDLKDHTDDMVEALWSWFSVTEMCAGWHGPVHNDGLLLFAIDLWRGMNQKEIDYAMGFL